MLGISREELENLYPNFPQGTLRIERLGWYRKLYDVKTYTIKMIVNASKINGLRFVGIYEKSSELVPLRTNTTKPALPESSSL